MIKVLIIDDSSFMRQELSRLISDDPEIEVIGTAFDGVNALKKLETLKPDVITLDIEMPQMDGLTFLKHIMISNPIPVVVISSLTQKGADVTLEAMRLGAVDIIAKPSGTISLDIKKQQLEIIQKIKAASKVDCSKIKRIHQQVPVNKQDKLESQMPGLSCKHVVAIGVSTGGPQTLLHIIPKLPADLPAAVFVVQHMPPVFTKSFADRLNILSNLNVKEAESKDKVLQGNVYIAPGDFHMTVNKAGNIIEIGKEPSDTLHRPAVDVMMHSLVTSYGKNITGVILTGMGKDGAEGLKRIHDNGGKTIAESENTSVVYGMPREAVRLGAADYILDNDKIAQKIVELVKNNTTTMVS